MRKKIMIYTISDLRSESLECVDLLYKSLLIKNSTDDFDFYVITNDKNYVNFDSDKYKFLFDNNYNSYIGWSKFSESIPKDYEFYLYFDSDILVYESLSNLIGEEDFTIVFEELKMSYLWFNFPYASETEKIVFNNTPGINAGTFGFRDLNFINSVRKYCEMYDFSNQNEIDQAKFEQSAFNYCIFKQDNKRIKDISKIVKLHAKENISEHSIYHFCGYEGHMNTKLSRMKVVNNKFLNNE